MEEVKDVENENLEEEFEVTDEQLEQLKDLHFENQEEETDESVTEVELAGLAAGLVELNELQNQLEAEQKQLDEELDELERRLNDLKVEEGEE